MRSSRSESMIWKVKLRLTTRLAKRLYRSSRPGKSHKLKKWNGGRCKNESRQWAPLKRPRGHKESERAQNVSTVEEVERAYKINKYLWKSQSDKAEPNPIVTQRRKSRFDVPQGEHWFVIVR